MFAMAKVTLKYDFRCPSFAPHRPQDLYQIALEQCEWADARGFSQVSVSEHHGAEDGYISSPITMLSAIASRTKHVRLQSCVLILPFHDPLRIAEDIAVLDLISNGRVELVVAAGYVPSEFDMFGRQLKERITLIEEGVAVLRNAWSGEPFDYRGRRCRVTPRPVQRPGPPILLGGGVPAAARRAARIGDGFVPNGMVYDVYVDECKKLGKRGPRTGWPSASFFHVAEDPEAAWEKIAPHAMHETNCYAQWQDEAGLQGYYQRVSSADEVIGNANYAVVTPDKAIEMINQQGLYGTLSLCPLISGLDAETSWAGLELFVDKVMPHIEVAAPGSDWQGSTWLSECQKASAS